MGSGLNTISCKDFLKSVSDTMCVPADLVMRVCFSAFEALVNSTATCPSKTYLGGWHLHLGRLQLRIWSLIVAGLPEPARILL